METIDSINTYLLEDYELQNFIERYHKKFKVGEKIFGGVENYMITLKYPLKNYNIEDGQHIRAAQLLDDMVTTNLGRLVDELDYPKNHKIEINLNYSVSKIDEFMHVVVRMETKLL